MLKFLKRHITTVLICIFLFFVGFSAFHLSFHSPSTSCLLIPPHPSSPRLLSPPPLCSHHFHWHPTLKVQFALRALQKDGTHRVQIVIAVTAQRPSACLCDLEWTSRATDVRQMPLSGTDRSLHPLPAFIVAVHYCCCLFIDLTEIIMYSLLCVVTEISAWLVQWSALSWTDIPLNSLNQ